MFARRSFVAVVALLTLLGATGCRPIGRASIPHQGSKTSPTSAASWAPSISGDGRLVAFASDAADLVDGDTNEATDLFVRDLGSGATERVNVPVGGGQSSGPASEPAISADGRFVAFTSSASDLVAGDTNDAPDVFVRDRLLATTTRVSTTAGGAQVSGASHSPSISASGDWIAFASTASNLVSGDTNGVADVFVARRTGGTVRRASAPDPLTSPLGQANGPSGSPHVIDPIGGYPGSGDPLVTYESRATNLAGTDGNGTGSDVFVTTYLYGSVARTVRVSQGSTLASDPVMGAVDGGPGFVVTYVRSDDGTAGRIASVARTSPVATDALSVTVIDVTNGGGAANGPSSQPAVTPDGRFVAFHSLAGNLAGRSEGPTHGDVYVGRSLDVRVDSVDPPRVGLGETRTLTITGSGFQPDSKVSLGEGVTVSSIEFVSSRQLVATVTVDSVTPGDPLFDVLVSSPGAGGSLWGWMQATCTDCVEVAAVVEQPGPVAVQITGGEVQVGALAIPVPGCTGATCIALPADVTADGDLTFGLDSVALDPIPIPVELIAGIETTIELVPRLDAPEGTVIPVTGDVDLRFGLAIGLRNPLLPASCAIGPVLVDLSAGPGGDPSGVAYDQSTGEATLAGGFTEELAVTGCGFFTGVLNGVLGFPIEIAENSVTLGVRFDPVLTGTATP